MTVCSFFLQGRCRYGDKCWNEHPRGGNRGGGGGGGGGFNNNYNRSSAPQQPRGGYGNKVWVNPSQQKGAYIQPSSFSSHENDDWGRGGGGGGGNDWGRGGGGGGGGGGGNDWGRGGGGRRDNVKSTDFSFSSQNRFSALGTPSSFDRGGRGGGQQVASGEDDDDRKLEIIQTDMDIWESSGQWGFSCYSNAKAPLSGFTDLSPEELRLEYYSTRASGDLQGYLNGINQLLNQWRSRVQELKVMNPATRTALLAELNKQSPHAPSSAFDSAPATGFGSSTSSFGSKGFGAPASVQANAFSFAAAGSGFGSSATPSSTGFGSTSAAPTQPPSGFGSSSAASSAVAASSFSFAPATSSTPAGNPGFGSASGFSFSSTGNTGGFGSGFGTQPTAATGSSSTFGFGAAAASPAVGAASAGGASDSLFTPEEKLTPEELDQFKSKRFTLGQIPLKPPPADMLAV